MKAYITVFGQDKVGIIAAVSNILAREQVNIEDLSQTILQGNFTMIMSVKLSEAGKSIEELGVILAEKGKELGLEITIRHMGIFEAMHRI